MLQGWQGDLAMTGHLSPGPEELVNSDVPRNLRTYIIVAISPASSFVSVSRLFFMGILIFHVLAQN